MRFLPGAILFVTIAVGGCASNKLASGGSTPEATTSAASYRDRNSGCYLMQPPMRHGNPDPHARLAQWQVLDFFDHTAQCDAARAQGLSAYASRPELADADPMSSVHLSRRLAESTLCVAGDDPRINWFDFQWPSSLRPTTTAGADDAASLH